MNLTNYFSSFCAFCCGGREKDLASPKPTMAVLKPEVRPHALPAEYHGESLAKSVSLSSVSLDRHVSQESPFQLSGHEAWRRASIVSLSLSATGLEKGDAERDPPGQRGRELNRGLVGSSLNSIPLTESCSLQESCLDRGM